jgi:hypothetical protein
MLALEQHNGETCRSKVCVEEDEEEGAAKDWNKDTGHGNLNE